jgi:outer membrane phospholipase A
MGVQHATQGRGHGAHDDARWERIYPLDIYP